MSVPPLKRSGWYLKGADELIRDLETAKLAGGPARRMLEKWCGVTLNHAMKNAPHFQGHYRRSLTSEVDHAPMPTYGRVGSNLQTPQGQSIVAAIEGGTGKLSDLPGGTKRRHWPPAKALDAWALKKQIARKDGKGVLTGRDVAAIIGIRGGLKPRRVLRNAAEFAEPKIPRFLDEMGAEIVAAFNRGALPQP